MRKITFALMESERMIKAICSIVEAAACVGCFVMAMIMMARKNRTEIPCDTCNNLVKKQRRSYKYLCCCRGPFDEPPQYCNRYCKRKNGGQDDANN